MKESKIICPKLALKGIYICLLKLVGSIYEVQSEQPSKSLYNVRPVLAYPEQQTCQVARIRRVTRIFSLQLTRLPFESSSIWYLRSSVASCDSHSSREGAGAGRPHPTHTQAMPCLVPSDILGLVPTLTHRAWE